MIFAVRNTRAEVAQAWAARRSPGAGAEAGPKHRPPPRPDNVQAVLDLGNLAIFHFRGRAYGVPPVPFDAGARLQAVYFDALAAGSGTLDRENLPKYHAALRALPPLLWTLTRPVGRLRRLLRALGLHRNPYRRATEAELVALANFFLTRRMISGLALPTTQVPG